MTVLFLILNTCVTHRVKAVHKNMDCDMTLTLSEPICYILLPPGLLMFRLHVIQTQPKDGCTKSSIVSKEVRVITLKKCIFKCYPSNNKNKSICDKFVILDWD